MDSRTSGFFLASVVPFCFLASAFRERGFDASILCRIESLPLGEWSTVNGQWQMANASPSAAGSLLHPALAIIPSLTCSFRQAEVEPQAVFRRAEALIGGVPRLAHRLMGQPTEGAWRLV